MRILFLGETFPEARRVLRPMLPDDEVVACPADRVLASVPGADVLVPTMSRIDAAAMDAGRPRLIQQFGVGLEGVDLAAARARGIPVANVPAAATGNAAATSELAVLLLLALARRLDAARAAVGARGLGEPLAEGVIGRTAVVLGVGAVGREVASRLRALGVRVVGVGRRPLAEIADPAPLDGYRASGELRAALSGAAALVVCCPLTPQTRGLVGAAELAAMRPGGWLVNVSRGAVVDRDALLDALRSGRLAGAGLDVYWQEPIDPADPILRENVIATAHVGGVTADSYEAIARAVADNVERLRRGEPLRNVH